MDEEEMELETASDVSEDAELYSVDDSEALVEDESIELEEEVVSKSEYEKALEDFYQNSKEIK